MGTPRLPLVSLPPGCVKTFRRGPLLKRQYSATTSPVALHISRPRVHLGGVSPSHESPDLTSLWPLTRSFASLRIKSLALDSPFSLLVSIFHSFSSVTPSPESLISVISAMKYWNVKLKSSSLPFRPKDRSDPRRHQPVISAVVAPSRKTINTYLPTELLREIFLYSIEGNQMKSGQLASVCRYWRSVITIMPSLWSTLRVGAWTESEQVATWLQRAYPLKVVIDTQRDGQSQSNAPRFSALQDALASTGQWHELTISSFPPENFASQLGFQVAKPMNVLRTLHVADGCVHSPSLVHLLDLIPSTDSSFLQLRLHSSSATAYFLQPHWLPALQNLTVLIVNGRDVQEPFQYLPAFTQLQILEAYQLPFPWYEPNANLPLLCTLQKLQIRASSVQWMAGREFPYLEECAIFLPHHGEAVQQHGVELPACRKLAYHGYPITTIQCFRVPQIKVMELTSHDCNQQRVYQHLRHLYRSNSSISKLTTLHLTLQCSGRHLIKVFKDMESLQELNLSVDWSSSSWESFLELLAAKTPAMDQPNWYHDNPLGSYHKAYSKLEQWEQWCSSQTWHVNVLPYLRYLGIQSPRGISQSQCLDNSPMLRQVGWTRAQLIPPLEHLKVWEGRGTTDDIMVDYISSGYLNKHLGIFPKTYDLRIIRGMILQCLTLHSELSFLKPFCSTALFRRLQVLEIRNHNDGTHFFPYLEQIKELEIWKSSIQYSLDVNLPLVNTLQKLELNNSTFSWMLGRTFKALKECIFHDPVGIAEDLVGYKRPLVDLPVCTSMKWLHSSVVSFPFSCPNVQSILWWSWGDDRTLRDPLKALHVFLLKCSCLQELDISTDYHPALDSLIWFALNDAREQGTWKNLRSVEAEVKFYSAETRSHFLNQMVGHQEHYEKIWNKFSLSEDDTNVILRALGE
jgi:hypothetical protein